ncbi:MAG: hypothetical protein ACREEM_27390 [Blastocatellia bacterium]
MWECPFSEERIEDLYSVFAHPNDNYCMLFIETVNRPKVEKCDWIGAVFNQYL